MVYQPCSPLIVLKAPNIRSLDESESNILPKIQGHERKTEDQRKARERKNKLMQGCWHRARQCKEAWAKFEFDLVEYDKKKAEWEDEKRRVTKRTNNSPTPRLENSWKSMRPSLTVMKNKSVDGTAYAAYAKFSSLTRRKRCGCTYHQGTI
jgi:hypothetical protein